MKFISVLLGSLFDRTSDLLAPNRQSKADIKTLCQQLLSVRGEVSGVAIAEQIFSLYSSFTQDKQLEFFIYILEEMDFDDKAVRSALTAYQQHPKAADYAAFMHSTQPLRRRFFRRLNEAPGATHALVAMRKDLLNLIKTHARLAIIDIDLRDLFISWFNRGFLVLRPINWSSPANILEKIISYEAVHEITSWDDLRLRLAPFDRCCFAFFHPSMPEEPLIFVEVALTDRIATSIQQILSESRDIPPLDKIDYAIFYSISNCQQGLAGISFGNSLIKTVVSELSQQYPQIKHFVTLSPLPHFARWLSQNKIQITDGKTIDGETFIKQNSAEVSSLAAYYLVHAKRDDTLPVDPVLRFHLGNGAQIYRLHHDADISERGQTQSYGIMVNYLYDRKHLADNHENFVDNGKIQMTSKISDLTRKWEGKIIPVNLSKNNQSPNGSG